MPRQLQEELPEKKRKYMPFSSSSESDWTFYFDLRTLIYFVYMNDIKNR